MENNLQQAKQQVQLEQTVNDKLKAQLEEVSKQKAQILDELLDVK